MSARSAGRTTSATPTSIGEPAGPLLSRSMQLRDQLIEFFAAKHLKPGDRLPSEEEIAEFGKVGRSTAREALKLLEQEGIVVVRQGKGRYLSSVGALNVERPISRYEPQSAMLAELGYHFETVTLSAVEGAPSEQEYEALQLATDEPVIRLERLRSASGEALVFSVCTIPRWCIPAPIRHIHWSASLNDLLAAQGLAPASSSARLRAVRLPAKLAKKYSLSAADAWLHISETVVTETGQRILYAEDYHRGDLFSFNVLRKP